MRIVLDKSYLQGNTKRDVSRLFRNHRLLMPDILFYELITTDNLSRAKCFSKLPNVENPVTLIPNIGQYLRFEYENRSPCIPITRIRERIRFTFNPRLAETNFELSEELNLLRDEEEKEILEGRKNFVDRSLLANEFFESKGSQNVEDNICSVENDPNVVRELYEEIIVNDNTYFDNPIPSKQLGPKWATYRWIQTQIIYGLRFSQKYQGKIPANVGEKFWNKAEHDMLDSHYVIFGSLSGAIATKDNTLQSRFKRLCKNGATFS